MSNLANTTSLEYWKEIAEEWEYIGMTQQEIQEKLEQKIGRGSFVVNAIINNLRKE